MQLVPCSQVCKSNINIEEIQEIIFAAVAFPMAWHEQLFLKLLRASWRHCDEASSSSMDSKEHLIKVKLMLLNRWETWATEVSNLFKIAQLEKRMLICGQSDTKPLFNHYVICLQAPSSKTNKCSAAAPILNLLFYSQAFWSIFMKVRAAHN